MTWSFQPFPAAATVTQPQVVAVGQATETDTANAVAWAPKNRLAAQITETDTANAVAWAPKIRSLAQITETDTAQAITKIKTKTVGAPAPITCTELTSDHDATSGTSATTASVTAEADRLYLVGVQVDNASGSPGTISVSGAGLTWEEIATTTFDTIASATARVSLFRAVGVGSGVLTLSSTSNEDFFIWGVYRLANVALGSNGADAIVQSATNRTNSAASLTVTLAALDAEGTNAVLVFGGAANVPTFTPEASWTELTDHFGVTADFRASTTDNTAVIDPTGSDALAAVAVELRAASAREIDTAQPITWAPKHRLAAQITETDTAQAITRVKSKVLGQPAETDTANAVTEPAGQTIAVGQATETDTAQAISRLAGVTHATGGAIGDTTTFNTSSFDFAAGEVAYMAVFWWGYGDTEITLSCPSWTKIGDTVLVGTYYAVQVALLRRVGTFSGFQTVTFGTTVGAYRYQCVKVTGTISPYERQNKSGNNGTGAKGTSLTVTFDTTPASNSPILSVLSDWDLTTITPRSGHTALYNNNDANIGTCAITFRSTTDTAVGVTSSGSTWLGALGVELAVTPPAVILGQVTETDLSQAVSRRKTKAVGQTTETDLAQAVTGLKTKTVTQATETDVSQAVSRIFLVAVGQATEADLAQVVSRRKTTTVAQVIETDIAQNVVRPGVVTQTTETDLAQGVTGLKAKTAGQATETETSQTITRVKTLGVSQITETATSQAITVRKTKTAGQPTETDLAQAVSRVLLRAVGQAAETDSATAASKRKNKAVAQVTETDLAQSISNASGVPELGNHLKLVIEFNESYGTTSFTTSSIDTVSGSTFVVFVGRGIISEHVAPTDNKGNTYTQIGTSHAYTNWPTSGTAVYACENGTGGSGHTWTIGRGIDDEITLIVVEVRNATRVAQHQWNEDLTDPPTTQSLTIAQPSVLLSAAYGDGAQGQTHYSTPGTGWTELEEEGRDLLVVQSNVASRTESSGTFSNTYTYDGTAEGAQLWILAVDAARLAKAVGQATETDTANGVSHTYLRSVAQIAEADLAQAVTKIKTKTVAQSSETELAQTVTGRKTTTVGQSSETAISQQVSSRKSLLSGQTTETDLAQASSRNKAKTAGQATETDLAQTVVRLKAKTAGQATETDLAQGVTGLKAKTAGQATETDLAQASSRNKAKVIAQTTETDTSQVFSSLKVKTFTQALEQDLAQAFTHTKTVGVSPAQEGDTAQPITEPGTIVVSVATAAEQDLAQAFSHLKVKAFAQAAEQDLAQTITPEHQRALSVAAEVDTAQVVAHTKLRLVPQATEQDEARPLRPVRVVSVSAAAEQDAAQAFTHVKRGVLQPATEQDTATRLGKVRSLARALEEDSAGGFGVLKRGTIGAVFEQDSAQTIAHHKVRLVAQAFERDLAHVFVPKNLSFELLDFHGTVSNHGGLTTEVTSFGVWRGRVTGFFG